MDSDSALGSDPEPDEIWDFGGPKLTKEQRKKRAKLKKLGKRRCFLPSPTPLRPEIRLRLSAQEPKPPPSPDDTAYRNALREQVAKLRKLVEEIAPEMLDSFPKLRPAKRLKLDDDSQESPAVINALDDSFDDESLALCTQQIEEQFMKSRACQNPDNRGLAAQPSESVTASASSSSDAQQDGRLKCAKSTSPTDSGKGVQNLLDDDNDEIFLSGALSSF